MAEYKPVQNKKEFNDTTEIENSIDDSSTTNRDTLSRSDCMLSIPTIESTGDERPSTDLRVFGNDIKIKYPTKMGNLYTFVFIRGQPLITIGPECIFLFKFSLYDNYPYDDYQRFKFWFNLLCVSGFALGCEVNWVDFVCYSDGFTAVYCVD